MVSRASMGPNYKKRTIVTRLHFVQPSPLYDRIHVRFSVYESISLVFFFFFFQAEDGIRDYKVTGVQTCALPISLPAQRGRFYRGTVQHRQLRAAHTPVRAAMRSRARRAHLDRRGLPPVPESSPAGGAAALAHAVRAAAAGDPPPPGEHFFLLEIGRAHV